MASAPDGFTHVPLLHSVGFTVIRSLVLPDERIVTYSSSSFTASDCFI